MEEIKKQAAQELGARLRIIRKSQKMSLQEVEKRSHGHWKAVVIGSYERADRALSVGKLAELLHFYQVPISSCFSMPSQNKVEVKQLILDLYKFRNLGGLGEEVEPARRYISAITTKREDWNGQMLSLRKSDLETLAILFETSEVALYEQFEKWGVLIHPQLQG
jgi:transcriptional regulator with XRE-family HTH domain